MQRHSDAAGAMRINGAWQLSPAVSRGPGSGQKDGVSCGGVGTCRRGRGDSGRRRGELQVPGLRDPWAGWGAPGTATRCHPRQVTASPGLGSSGRAAFEGNFVPARRLSAPTGSGSIPCHRDPAGMPGARHGTFWPKVTRRVGGRGGMPACPLRQHRGRAALPSRCPRFAPAVIPLQTLHLPPVCPPCPCRMLRRRPVGHRRLLVSSPALLGKLEAARAEFELSGLGGQTPCPRFPNPVLP